MYVYCVVCYHVITIACVRSFGCISAYIYTLFDDLEHYKLSSPTKVFSSGVVWIVV